MAITISDVAAEAGVSKSTVSKVLNNWSTISPATVQKVNSAIQKLNYIPNSRAVCFAKQTTDNIVYLTNLSQNVSYQNPHMFDIMCGVQHELSKHNYSVTLVDTSEESYPGERSMQEITRRSADGLIIHGSAVSPELAQRLIHENVPHIIIGHPDFDSRLCWIDTNHSLAGEYAARHMIECGYYNVIFIAGRKNDKISSERLKGFLQGMLGNAHHISKDHIGYTNSSRQSAYEVTTELLQQFKHNPPQAIVCENTMLALGATAAIQALGLHIPSDIALLTFDLYPYANIMDPTPTVIDINMYDMGMQAGNMMIRKLQNPDLLIQSFTTLPLLVQGDSTIRIPCSLC